jgi:hypothetical protein
VEDLRVQKLHLESKCPGRFLQLRRSKHAHAALALLELQSEVSQPWKRKPSNTVNFEIVMAKHYGCKSFGLEEGRRDDASLVSKSIKSIKIKDVSFK